MTFELGTVLWWWFQSGLVGLCLPVKMSPVNGSLLIIPWACSSLDCAFRWLRHFPFQVRVEWWQPGQEPLGQPCVWEPIWSLLGSQSREHERPSAWDRDAPYWVSLVQTNDYAWQIPLVWLNEVRLHNQTPRKFSEQRTKWFLACFKMEAQLICCSQSTFWLSF